MAAETGTITSADLLNAASINMNADFDGAINKIQEVMGVFEVETLAAGTVINTYKVSGTLNKTARDEGDLVPLSKYEEKKVGSIELTLNAYRKRSTGEAIQKAGVASAIMATDNKMLKDLRGVIFDDFITELKKGTSTAGGQDIQAVLANMDGVLDDTLSKNNDASEGKVYFANPLDRADWLANHVISGAQSLYGMQYIQGFLGLNGLVFFDGRIPKGTAIVTPRENIHIYSPDFGAYGQGGLDYSVSDLGLIGVSHEPVKDHFSVDTHVICGVKIMPRVLDYIVVGSISDTNKA